MSSYYVRDDYRASCIRQLRCMVDCNRNGLLHPDLPLSRITKDEEDVEYLIYILENNWFNPFTSEALDLCNLSTAVSPEKDLVTDILTAKEKGDQIFVNFLTKIPSGDRAMKLFDIFKIEVFIEIKENSRKR